jgi:beta-glucosidase
LERIEKYIQPYDPELIKFDFDFIGVQNYYSLVAYDVPLVPYIGALIKPFHKLNRKLTSNGWEVYPEGMYKILKQFGKYPIKKILVTENGAAFHDKVQNGRVHDKKRVEFLQKYIGQVLRAKNEGVNIEGYFVWSLMDNFEWKAGFKSRFGIVHTDFKTQKRIIKDSGLWIRDFLED